MQVGGTAQVPPAIPRRTRLSVMLSIAVLAAAMVVLVVVAGILMTRGGAEEAFLEPQESWATLYDADSNAHQVRVRTRSVTQDASSWVTFQDGEGNPHQVRVR